MPFGDDDDNNNNNRLNDDDMNTQIESNMNFRKILLILPTSMVVLCRCNTTPATNIYLLLYYIYHAMKIDQHLVCFQ